MFDFVYCFRINIFTSKISNLLLPLIAEGVVAVNHTQPMIYPIDISETFLMIYLSIFVAVFLLFGTSKELVRDSQRL